MTTSLRFFKLTTGPYRGWFADVTNHTLAENQMVAGSDTFLDELDSALGGRGEVIITLSDSPTDANLLAVLTMKAHNQWGATYTLSGPIAESQDLVDFNLWICNVTHDVLGEHPRIIYLLGFN